MTTVRDASLELLRAFGMQTIFGNPGSTEVPMFRDFPSDFRYVLGLQESVVLGMADGYAQATRNAAFVNLHSAAGTGHALGNLFTAFKNQTPLVITAGQQARSMLPFEPFLFADRPTEFPRPYIKWACEPARAQDVPAAIARAFYVAMEPPCGPTFVSVPVDDWDQPCERIEPRRVAALNPGDPIALAEAATKLSRARHPVFVVGAGVARDDAWSEMIALAEQHSASVWVAPMSARNSFPENHALFAGFLTAAREAIVNALSGHDLIVALGGPMSLYHVEGFGPHLPAGAELIQVVDNHAQASWCPSGMSIVAHAKYAIRALLAGPEPIVRQVPRPLSPPADLDPREFTDAYLLQQIAKLRPPGSIIVEEAPSSRSPMHRYLPIVERDTFYTCASGGLGHSLPAAIGVALARPKEKVIAVLGDGSSMYAIQGLWSAVQLRLPISFIIINNRRYQALVQIARAFGVEQTVGTDLPSIDFCALAQGVGLRAMRADNGHALNDALVSSFQATVPTLVEVVVE